MTASDDNHTAPVRSEPWGPAPAFQHAHMAIVGAGMAGAACAHDLARAGLKVSVFEKSRGAGGRMATRRARLTDEVGREHLLNFDHGAPGFLAFHPAFREAVSLAASRGLLAPWEASGAREPTGNWVALPDQPSWARHLLGQAELHVQHTVCGLKADAGRWFIECAERPHELIGPFDGLALAIPAIQAAALLDAVKADWAREARSVQQQAIWTLMAARPDKPGRGEPGQDVIRPAGGPLALIVRQDRKPGRGPARGVAGHEAWVAHATADWTLQHLEAPADEVREALLRALEGLIAGASQAGEAGQWTHAVVHRWRYAMVSPEPRDREGAGSWTDRLCLWDPALALGMAGDAFAGEPLAHTGVQRAWLSGTALAAQMLERLRPSE